MRRSSWIRDLQWVRPGRQTRSQQTQARLLESAAVLFAEKGVEATSVADVAAHAGCTEMKGKTAETAYFDAAPFSEGVGHVVNQGFYGELHIPGRQLLVFLGNTGNQFRFG